jgi:UDP-N-acetylmuramate--alanine ligase
VHTTINIAEKDQANFAKALQGGTVYFIGIGGIGMSALAKYFISIGCTVSGYDRTRTELTIVLENMGIQIHYTEDIPSLPIQTDIVIYTPAIPKEHAELVYYQNTSATLLKRSQVLGLLTQHSTNICVAGTHGKTTVSTMISHLLYHTDYGCTAFLGGIATNYHTNFINSTVTSNNNVCVIEADEYDRSFLQLSPSMAVITSMDADHLDIYGTAQAMEEAFIQFSKQIVPNGFLIAKYGLQRFNELAAATKYSYHLSDNRATVYAQDIKVENGGYRFDMVINGTVIDNILLNVGGLHNIENAIAAIAIANHLQIDMEKVKEAVANYKGVKRRFEYIIAPNQTDALVMIDDYAHHPTELDALLTGVHSLFPQRKKIVVFQPHLYSRTNDFAAAFSASLSKADRVILLPIYPARELPMPGVQSEMLLPAITAPEKNVMEKEFFLNWVTNDLKKNNSNTVLIMAGAGDIDLLLQPVKKILTT